MSKNVDPYRTTFHRNGDVTLWNVYEQSWTRTRHPSDRVLASLDAKERERVIRHTMLCRVSGDETAHYRGH